MQPVPLRPGRGARLSFLGGRKKEAPPQQNGELGHISEAGSSEHNSKGADSHGRSNFRSQSHENQRPGPGTAGSASNGTHPNGPVSRSGTEASEWVTDSGSHASHDTRILAGTSVDSLETKERESVGVPRLGSVKKRLSMLMLSKKPGKGNGEMDALHEE